MSDHSATSFELDDMAHALEVILLTTNEVETRTEAQFAAKAWAVKTLRAESYRLRDEACKLRLSFERDAKAAARRAMLPDLAACDRAWNNTNNPAIPHPRDWRAR